MCASERERDRASESERKLARASERARERWRSRACASRGRPRSRGPASTFVPPGLRSITMSYLRQELEEEGILTPTLFRFF